MSHETSSSTRTPQVPRVILTSKGKPFGKQHNQLRESSSTYVVEHSVLVLPEEPTKLICNLHRSHAWSTVNSQLSNEIVCKKINAPPKPCIFGPACGSSLPTAIRSSRQVESSTTGSSQASTGNASRGAHATRLGASLLQLPKPRQRDGMTSAGMTLVPGGPKSQQEKFWE